MKKICLQNFNFSLDTGKKFSWKWIEEKFTSLDLKIISDKLVLPILLKKEINYDSNNLANVDDNPGTEWSKMK